MVSAAILGLLALSPFAVVAAIALSNALEQEQARNKTQGPSPSEEGDD